MKVTLTQVDTACMVININGFVIVTDPAFDEAGGEYPATGGRFLYKTGSPKLLPNGIGPVDLVLLSHDHHKDNLDNTGKEFLKTVNLVLSTPGAVERLHQDNITALHEWESIHINTSKVPGLKITATPCQHASTKEWAEKLGHVIGFMLEWDGQQNGALYISGDTVYYEGVEQVAQRFKVNTAILHVGRAGLSPEDDLHFTFTAKEAIQTARLMKVQHFVPTHFEGWKHFQEEPGYLYNEVIHSDIKEKLVWLQPGTPTIIEI
jgi:L-ascorbate metabolism protein UlaG (beta-lactamase superfamily)